MQSLMQSQSMKVLVARTSDSDIRPDRTVLDNDPDQCPENHDKGAVGIALNGVEIYGPYNADTCCDFAADSLDKVDFCMGYSSATYPSYRSSS